MNAAVMIGCSIFPSLNDVFNQRMSVPRLVVVPDKDFNEIPVNDPGHGEVCNGSVSRSNDIA